MFDVKGLVPPMILFKAPMFLIMSILLSAYLSFRIFNLLIKKKKYGTEFKDSTQKYTRNFRELIDSVILMILGLAIANIIPNLPMFTDKVIPYGIASGTICLLLVIIHSVLSTTTFKKKSDKSQ
jgi:hypothetical protein